MTNPTNPPHEYLEDILTPAALGIPSDEELDELEALLEENAEARAEFASLQALAADLSMLADERAPSAGLRDRLELAIQADATPQTPSSSTPVSPTDEPVPIPIAISPEPQSSGNITPMRPYLLAAAAAAIVLALVGGILLDRFVLQDDPGTDVQEIAYDLTLPEDIPDLSAELLYNPDEQLFTLKTSNMPAAPEGQVYQIWLIDREGVPQPKGVMNEPDFAVAANRDDYVAFAITTEPGPLGSEGPTTDPFFVAPLDPESVN